jgi:hypothetical protein
MTLRLQKQEKETFQLKDKRIPRMKARRTMMMRLSCMRGKMMLRMNLKTPETGVDEQGLANGEKDLPNNF